MAEPSIIDAAFRGQCPRCGAKTLFEAPAQFAITCSQCDLPFGELEGWGRFIGLFTAIIALILITIAMAVDAWLSPPFWLQVVIWAPLTIGVVLGALRVFKVVPLLAHYQRRYGDEEG